MSIEASDFPFVADQPTRLGGRGGAFVLIGCAFAFALLVALPKAMTGAWVGWLTVVAFVGVQLAGLRLAVGSEWTAVFRRISLRHIVIALAAVPLAIALPGLVAVYVVGSPHLAHNTMIANVAGMSALDLANTFALTGVQLVGEELVTILPFLVVLTLVHRAGASSSVSIGIAWLITSIAFGALHLATYEWNVAQALLVIGTARLVLTAVYIVTRNLWASIIAHVVNDWSMMVIAILAASNAV